MSNIGFIGAGNMAGAIIDGIINNKEEKNIHINIFDIDEEKKKKFQDKGCSAASSARELCENSDIIFFAVKPQIFPEVMQKISGIAESNPGKIFVTIAAGITTKYIASFIGESAKIIRVMPNTPLMIGAGASALCKNKNVSDGEYERVIKIFEKSSVIARIEENQMNEIVSVNGSSPAYIYLFAKAVIEKAVSYGIDETMAKDLISATLIGSARMITESKLDPQTLIDMVTSKGGTTYEALEVFYKNNFEDIIKSAMDACTKRAYELEK